jgi:RHS repeat-associated protein
VPNASNYSCASPNSASTSTYAYNGDGLRTSDTPAGSSTQQFTWDVTQSTPNLLADGTNSYLYGPGGVPVEQIVTSTSTASYLVSDPTGVRYQFTVAGTVTGSASYGPYGKCISCTISTPFGFEDGYKDPTGLIYLINRYYDPATEQFISVDPLVSVTGQPFSYANGNPVNGSDPSGLDFWSDVSSVATVVAVVAVVATVTVTTAGVGDVVIAGAGGAIAGGISGSGLATAGLVTAGGAASVALGSDLAQEFQSSAGSFPSSVLQTRKSGKEKANDLPSWVNPEECQPQDGEKPVDVARRVVDNAPAGVSRGPGPRSPYNQIRKYVSKKYFGR